MKEFAERTKKSAQAKMIQEQQIKQNKMMEQQTNGEIDGSFPNAEVNDAWIAARDWCFARSRISRIFHIMLIPFTSRGSGTSAEA
jgi:hypothetical protein